MSFVIYNIETTGILAARRKHSYGSVDSYKTERAAKAALTRLDKAGMLGEQAKEDFAIADTAYFRAHIEKQVEVINLMSGEPYMEAYNTPSSCSPACETYWSM